MTEEQRNHSQSVFNTICAMFQEKNWSFQPDQENLKIKTEFSGNDFPMEIRILVRPEIDVVSLFSQIPVTVPEEKRFEMAVATASVTDRLINGSFDYNPGKGYIIFRLAQSYRDSILGKGVFAYMINIAAQTVDEYNDKFMMLAKGYITLEQFLAEIDK